MKRRSLILFSLLLLVCLIASLAYSQNKNSRERLKPFTDGTSHTSGENGKWVKGCSAGQQCNMGVGNLGPANTYHWVD
jgi:hypothetical protein